MDVVKKNIVDVDLNNDNSSDDENQFQSDEHINKNERIVEIPLIESSNIGNEIDEEDKPDYDKYGFKKSYKYISKERQEEYEIYYQKVLERREQKWNILIEEHGREFPPMSSKLKRFIRKGIPGYIRSYCWFYYSGAKEEMLNNRGLYKKLLNCEYTDRSKGLTKNDSKALDCIYGIEKDLFRTFPDNKYFEVDSSVLAMDGNENSTSPSKKYYVNPYIGSLRNILVAFVYYSLPKSDNGYGGTSYTIGYCQSLNYIAGLLLLIFSLNNEQLFKNTAELEEMCFWVFATLIGKILPKEMYGENGMEGAIIEQELLWNLIIDENGRKFGVKKVAKWKKDMEKKNNMMNGLDNVPESENLTKLGILTFKWMTTCFVGVLPIETVLRVWDCIFTEGSITILRVTLTLLRIYENDISKNDDELEGWDFINKLPYKIIDCHRFMEICFRPRYSINPFKNLYYSITLNNPITQSELKKNTTSGEMTTPDADAIQQHEIQYQQQQQLYQVLQNPNQTKSRSQINIYSNDQDLNQDSNQHVYNIKNKFIHQRNKSFSFFLSSKNQSYNKDRSNIIHPIDNKFNTSKQGSILNINSNESSLENSIDSMNDDDKDDNFEKHRKKTHKKSYSESIKENSYNYDSINNNNVFEGAFHNRKNRISSAFNLIFTNPKKNINQKDSEKVSKKNFFDNRKKKGLSISNFDIFKKQVENINKKKNNDGTNSCNNVRNNNCVLSDNNLNNIDKNKDNYSLNGRIKSSVNFYNCENDYDKNKDSLAFSGKSNLNNEKVNIKNFNNDIDNNDYNNFHNIDSNTYIIEDKEKIKHDNKKKNDENNSNVKNLSIIIKPQVITSKESLIKSPTSLDHLYPESPYTPYKDCISDESPLFNNNSNSNEKIENKALNNNNNNNNKNMKSESDIENLGVYLNVKPIFNNKLIIPSSGSNNLNISSNEGISSSNEKIISSDNSLDKRNNDKKKSKVTISTNDIYNINKNIINGSNLNMIYSPSLSIGSQSSLSSHSTDITFSSQSSFVSEDDDDDEFFFDINEFSGTINGDLLKMNEENKKNLNSKDHNNTYSNEEKKNSFVSLNNDIIIKTIKENLKKEIIDKEQKFKFLDLLNGSKIGPYNSNLNSISNETNNKQSTLSFQYNNKINNNDKNNDNNNNLNNKPFTCNNYYSLNNLNQFALSPSQTFSEQNSDNNHTKNIQKSRHYSFDNKSKTLDNNNNFRSFVDIYYQFNENLIKVNSDNKDINKVESFNDDEIKNSEKSHNKNLPSTSCNKKTHCNSNAYDVKIHKNNNDIKTKEPNIRVHCSNDINNQDEIYSTKTDINQKMKKSIYDSELSNEKINNNDHNKCDYKLTKEISSSNPNPNNENKNDNIKDNYLNKSNSSINNNNNNSGINNNNKSGSNNTNTKNDDELSPMSTSSNNDLMEQIQIFWKVTFPKNEGYHLVLRKGGIGNLSNKVINKYRKKLWDKRLKEKKKESKNNK